MERNIIILNEMYKTVTMGIIGIDDVIEKIDDKALEKSMLDAKKKYQIFKMDITKVLKKYKEEPAEINPLLRASNEIYTEFKTIKTSDGKIVKMLMEGTNKGIIKLQEIKNNEEISDEDIKKILLDLLELLEYQISAWKKYL